MTVNIAEINDMNENIQWSNNDNNDLFDDVHVTDNDFKKV